MYFLTGLLFHLSSEKHMEKTNISLLEKSAKSKELLDKWKEIDRLQHSPVEILDQ